MHSCGHTPPWLISPLPVMTFLIQQTSLARQPIKTLESPCATGSNSNFNADTADSSSNKHPDTFISNTNGAAPIPTTTTHDNKGTIFVRLGIKIT